MSKGTKGTEGTEGTDSTEATQEVRCYAASVHLILPFLLLLLSACVPRETPKGITLLDGTPATLEQLTSGKPSIVNFWAGWCVFCKDELPLFEEIHQTHPEVAVIGINLQEPPKAAREYWERGGYSFPSLLDPKSKLKRRFSVFTQPTTFFLDPAGNQVSRKDGPLTREELQEYTDKLLEYANRRPTPIEATKLKTQSSRSGPEPVQGRTAKLMTSSVPPHLSSWYQDSVVHSIPLEEVLSGGPPKDGIPSIDNPEFTPVQQASFLDGDDVGLLLTINSDTRFYPFRILNWHEVVNDVVGGVSVAVTYCPLCATAVVFDRTISIGTVEFGVSGFLYQSNLLMYDRVSSSLWNQAKGEAVVGPLTGEVLRRVRSDVVQFSTVQSQFPNAKILTAETGARRDYSRNPYAGYDERPDIFFPVNKEDSRLHPKALVYGIVVEGQPKAYPLDILKAKESVEDTIGSIPITVTFDPATESVQFWNIQTNEEIVPLPAFWFSWIAQYPDTQLYE